MQWGRSFKAVRWVAFMFLAHSTPAAYAAWSCIDAAGNTHTSEKRIWTQICTNLETGEVPTLMEGLQKKPPFKSNPKVAKQVMANGKATLLSHLKDPDSARFRNLFTADDVVTCGEVNARNSMGGYAGFTRFVVFANKVHLDGSDQFEFLWAITCDRMYAGDLQDLKH